MSKLILRALFSSDKFTFDKRYDSLNGEKGATIADGHWVKNDLGNYAFIPGNQIKTGLNDDGKTDFRFELMLQFDAPRLSDEIKERVAKSIESACKPGGAIHSEFNGHGFQAGSFFGDVIKNATVQEIKATEHDKALSEMDKHLPAYRRSDKGFQLSESVEWLGKLNSAHEKACIKYEAIIENLMEAFDIKTHDELHDLAQRLVKSKRVIDEVNKAK